MPDPDPILSNIKDRIRILNKIGSNFVLNCQISDKSEQPDPDQIRIRIQSRNTLLCITDRFRTSWHFLFFYFFSS